MDNLNDNLLTITNNDCQYIFFIVNLCNSLAVRQYMDWFLYAAYGCFVFGQLLWSTLFLRIFIMIGCGFHLVWAFLTKMYPKVQVEHFSFNSAFFIIHLVHIIVLLYNRKDPRLTKEQENIYKVFSKSLTKKQFLNLLSVSSILNLSKEQSNISRIGESFRDVIYLSNINENYKISVENENGVVEEIKSGQWIGAHEYSKRAAYLKDMKIGQKLINEELELLWNSSAKLKEINKKNDNNSEDGNNNIILKNRIEICTVLRVSIDVRFLYIET